jgi:hypothetical protein
MGLAAKVIIKFFINQLKGKTTSLQDNKFIILNIYNNAK